MTLEMQPKHNRQTDSTKAYTYRRGWDLSHTSLKAPLLLLKDFGQISTARSLQVDQRGGSIVFYLHQD